jgi:hypothetical protein
MNQCRYDIFYLTVYDSAWRMKFKAVAYINHFYLSTRLMKLSFRLIKKWRFYVFTTTIMKTSIFWVMTPCIQVDVHWRFAGQYYLHLQRRTVSILPASCSQLAWFSFRLWRWRQNVLPTTFEIITDYTASHPRRMYSSLKLLNAETSKKWVPDETDKSSVGSIFN